MSNKGKKIKSLKKKLKELRAELRKLKSASARRRKSKMTKARGQKPKPRTPAATRAKSEESLGASGEMKSVAIHAVGQR
jgi:hypothetical protein